jgi:hypothetical protein
MVCLGVCISFSAETRNPYSLIFPYNYGDSLGVFRLNRALIGKNAGLYSFLWDFRA